MSSDLCFTCESGALGYFAGPNRSPLRAQFVDFVGRTWGSLEIFTPSV